MMVWVVFYIYISTYICWWLIFWNNFCVVHASSKDESPTHEGKYEADRDWGDKQFEWEHVAASDALRGPGAVMVEFFNTIVAESTMLCEHVLARDSLALMTEFGTADS